jgi:peroxiredoxin
MSKIQNNQAIKLLKQLIGITTNKKDKANLMNLLKQTIDDTTQTNTKQKKFNIRTFPATKAKAVGFKTKKAMIEFVKVNDLDIKTIHTDNEFTQYITKKFKIFNQLEEIMTMHNKGQAVLEERKPKPKPVNYTAKFRIFQIVGIFHALINTL